MHAEAVAGIAGRPELLAALFFLLTIHLHRRAPAAARPALVRAAAAACFASALLSKESAMTLVLVLPVMDALVPAVRRDGQPAGLRLRSSSITCRSRWSLSSISPCVAPCSRASSSAKV